jgi:hypothetical protein
MAGDEMMIGAKLQAASTPGAEERSDAEDALYEPDEHSGEHDHVLDWHKIARIAFVALVAVAA